MSFQPVLPLSGIGGWKLLQNTLDTQTTAFNASPQIQRDVDYFKANIGTVRTAEDLVTDRRLLSVALGAFGLSEDIDNTYFVKKVLEDGALDDTALANRLADKRYLSLTESFGFGDSKVVDFSDDSFVSTIAEAYQTREFEVAVGESDEDLRLALGVERELTDILAKSSTEDGYWLSVLGNAPMREVFEQALNMPSELASLDLDRQVDDFRAKANQIFGGDTLDVFADPATREKLVHRFLLMADLENSAATTSSGSIALALLQNSASR